MARLAVKVGDGMKKILLGTGSHRLVWGGGGD